MPRDKLKIKYDASPEKIKGFHKMPNGKLMKGTKHKGKKK